MQQTEKYKLNLIESSDTFSPEALNQNTQRVEDVLVERMEGSLDAMQGQVDAIAKNLGSVGRNARLIWGSYVGTGEYGKDGYYTTLTFDFYPVLFASGFLSHTPVVVVRGVKSVSFDSYSTNMGVTWLENGVKLYNSSNAQHQLNKEKTTYYYLVIGYDFDEA